MYMNLKNDKELFIYFLHGAAGSGKTILIRYIIRHILGFTSKYFHLVEHIRYTDIHKKKFVENTAHCNSLNNIRDKVLAIN